MKRRYYIICIPCLIFFISTHCFSQDTINKLDTINLLSGKQIIAKISFYDIDNTFLEYDILKMDKFKRKRLDKIDIFSINFADKSRKILYFQDSILGYPLSLSEMEHFVLGGQQAAKNYKVPWVTVFGVATGAAATYFLTFWGLSSTIAYPLGIGITDTKIKTSDSVSSNLKNDKNFINGYKTYATKKKVKNAIYGSIVGTAALVILYQFHIFPSPL